VLSKSLLFFCACILCAGAARATAPPEVTTIAGSGAPGIADGPAHKATFLFPSGIAIARDGSIYISDRAAQRIRLLTRSGEVRTVAGSGAIVPPGIFVTPGYRDGAALQAQFNGPEGLAIGPDGALYIADSNNGCIRKLLLGQVTTVVGKCGQNPQPYRWNPAFVVDGPIETASLIHPSALAFDAAGDLYIADNGGGLRRWANGVLTTDHFAEEHSLPQGEAISAIGVAVAGGADPVIVVSTYTDVFAYYPLTGRDTIMYPDKLSDGNPFGHPNQLAAIDAQQFLFTDLITANIRYLRLQKLPFNGSVFTRVIAGGRYERGSDNAGFANGTPMDSRFYDPMGIAVVGNSAVVADGGNRRIRQIVLPASRVSEAGFDPANHVDTKHYEVALIGASWSFWDTLGDDSICAHIEATLNRSHRFRKPVRCHTIRIDAGKVGNFEDYIKKIFPYERMDLVIMDAEAYASALPAAKEARAAFGPTFRAHMQQPLAVLKPLRTRLALLWIYNAQDTSDSEWIVQGFPFFRAPPGTYFHEDFTELAGLLRGTPILHYDMYDDIMKYELSIGATPLYLPTSQHPNSRGNAFFGDHIAQGLLAAGLGNH
jgi:hypothetical protein